MFLLGEDGLARDTLWAIIGVEPQMDFGELNPSYRTD